MTEPLIPVFIDGRRVEVPKGTLLLQVLLGEGVPVQHDCYHPSLSVAGTCGTCVVEVTGEPDLQRACLLEVRPEMEVRTRSARVQKKVRALLELTLLNHPLDCPVCEQSGECSLQQAVERSGLGDSRVTVPRQSRGKGREIGPNLRLNPDRCTLCGKCVRFQREVLDSHELVFLHRGAETEISALTTVDHPYTGNLVDLCTVGAITASQGRLHNPSSKTTKTPSVCPGCARGCNVELEAQGDRLVRIRPRFNPEVNQSWMCDHGRTLLSARSGTHETPRLTTPMLRREGVLAPVNWTVALETLSSWLLDQSGQVSAMMSSHMSVEEACALRLLLEQLGAPPASPPEADPQWEKDWLRDKERAPNRAGVTPFCSSRKEPSGSSPSLELRFFDLPTTATIDKHGKKRLVFFGTHECTPLAEVALVLPIAHWTERRGNSRNVDGILQQAEAAVTPCGSARPLGDILMDLLSLAGSERTLDLDALLKEALQRHPTLLSTQAEKEE